MFYGKNNSKGEFDMTFQQLRYVIKIVETGSISAAAKEMFVSQPSLSKAVMDLEYELGTTIFIREKKESDLLLPDENLLHTHVR